MDAHGQRMLHIGNVLNGSAGLESCRGATAETDLLQQLKTKQLVYPS